MSEIDEQLMQHSKDFFNTIFAEVFRENTDLPITRELFDAAVTSIGIEGSELEEFHKLYASVKKLPNGTISKENLIDAIYQQFKPQAQSDDSAILLSDNS